jgi:hypothetical protein
MKILITLFLTMMSLTVNAENKLDLSSVGLVTHATQKSCEDKQGNKYSGNTKLDFLVGNNYYTVNCDNRGFHSYAWEVISFTQSAYSNKTYDSLGCRDAHNRIYDEKSRITEKNISYTCNFKSNKYYWSIDSNKY